MPDNSQRSLRSLWHFHPGFLRGRNSTPVPNCAWSVRWLKQINASAIIWYFTVWQLSRHWERDMHRLGPQCSAADTAERWRDMTHHDWQASRPISVTLPTRPQLFHHKNRGLWQLWTAVLEIFSSFMGPWRRLGPVAAAPVALPILAFKW